MKEMGMMGRRCERNGFSGYLKKWKCMEGMEEDHVCMVPTHVGRYLGF